MKLTLLIDLIIIPLTKKVPFVFFLNAILLSSFLIFNGCQHQQPSHHQTLESQLSSQEEYQLMLEIKQKFCLQTKGKARVTFHNDQHRFTYLLKREEIKGLINWQLQLSPLLLPEVRTSLILTNNSPFSFQLRPNFFTLHPSSFPPYIVQKHPIILDLLANLLEGYTFPFWSSKGNVFYFVLQHPHDSTMMLEVSFHWELSQGSPLITRIQLLFRDKMTPEDQILFELIPTTTLCH
jgi:hypothetical protein